MPVMKSATPVPCIGESGSSRNLDTEEMTRRAEPAPSVARTTALRNASAWEDGRGSRATPRPAAAPVPARRSNTSVHGTSRRITPAPVVRAISLPPGSAYSSSSTRRRIRSILVFDSFGSAPPSSRSAWRSASASAGRGAVGGGEAGVDPLGDQPLGLVDQRVDHLVLGDDPDDLAPG